MDVSKTFDHANFFTKPYYIRIERKKKSENRTIYHNINFVFNSLANTDNE
jgi:hypothetical protein